jgi:2-hydroxycyclohexanecarboxyl-CoA dehydrogenase
MRGLKDKVALVTGAGGAIGGAIARRLAEDGVAVSVLDLNADGAHSTAEAIQRAGGRAHAVPVDITDYPAVQEAVAAAEKALGPPELIVSSAGWDRVRPFLDTDPQLWDQVIAVNLRGLIHVCHAALPGMVERRSGAVVNIASDAGRVGSSGESVYAACKGGVIAFTKSIAREVAGRGIRVNCVCPGPTDTPLFNSFLEEGEYGQKIHGALHKVIPMRRIAQPEDVVGMVAFLCSDEAGYITGQVVSVSGGLTMVG